MAETLERARPLVRPDDAAGAGALCQSCRAPGRRLWLVTWPMGDGTERTFSVCADCAGDAAGHSSPWEGDVAEAA